MIDNEKYQWTFWKVVGLIAVAYIMYLVGCFIGGFIDGLF